MASIRHSGKGINVQAASRDFTESKNEDIRSETCPSSVAGSF